MKWSKFSEEQIVYAIQQTPNEFVAQHQVELTAEEVLRSR